MRGPPRVLRDGRQDRRRRAAEPPCTSLTRAVGQDRGRGSTLADGHGLGAREDLESPRVHERDVVQLDTALGVDNRAALGDDLGGLRPGLGGIGAATKRA